MTHDLTERPNVGPDAALSGGVMMHAAPGQQLQSHLDFEVHVAAGQAWLAMPGHSACRAMYPDYARALATAIEEIAADGGGRRIYVAQDVSLLIARQEGDLVLIREEISARPEPRNAVETLADAYRLAKRIREAADRAERTAWFTRAA
jgi:hypothetical protein